MVNGPPCAACRSPLRWSTDQTLWACEQCQQTYSAAGQPLRAVAAPAAAPEPATAAEPAAVAAGAAPGGAGAPAPVEVSPYAPRAAAPAVPAPAASPPAAAPPYSPHAGPAAASPYAPYAGPAAASPYAPYAGPGAAAYSPVRQSVAAAPPSRSPRASAASSKVLWIGLGCGIAAAGVAIAITFSLRESSGRASRDEVVRETIAALAEGSVDTMLELADPSGRFARAFDCEPDDGGDPGRRELDPERQIERARLEYSKLVVLTRGVKLAVVDIRGDGGDRRDAGDVKDASDARAAKDAGAAKDTGDARHAKHARLIGRGVVARRGDRVTRTCTARTDLELHEVRIELEIGDGDQPVDTQRVTMTVAEVGGRFYLAAPPTIAVLALALGELSVLRDRMCGCKDRGCRERADDEHRAWTERQPARDALSERARERLGKLHEQWQACRSKLLEADPVGKLLEIKEQMCACRDEACANRVNVELTLWSSVESRRTTPSDLPGEDQRQLVDIYQEVGRCMMKAANEDARLDDVAPGMPDECQAYRAAIARLLHCDRFPAPAQDGLIKAWQSMVEDWRASDGSDRTSVMAQCTAGRESAAATADALCPSDP